jgi:glycine betaine/proline transport system ATP-binding protein
MTAISFSAVGKIYGPTPETALALLTQGLTKADVQARTKNVVALHDVTLDIAVGELFVIMGRSGSGKSTLLRTINRLVEPTHGTVRVIGSNICDLDDTALTQFRKTQVSMVFQHFGLLPHKTALENVAFPLSLQNVPKPERTARAEQWLARVGLAGYRQAYPDQLSSGMRQRVGLARALITEAPILLMDEPFAALDPLTRREMQDEVLRLKAELNKTVVMISHDPMDAARMATRMAVLQDGRLSQVGSPESLREKPATPEVRAFVTAIS